MKMSKFLSDIKTYLVAQGVTTSIYLSYLDSSIVPGIALYEYPGEEPDTLVDIYNPRLQVKVQVANASYETGRELIETVEGILQGLANTALSNNYVIQCFMITGAIPLGEDVSGNLEFVSNFRFKVR